MQFRAFLRRFRLEELGQDLAEYCLLTALLTLVAAGILVHASGGLSAVWNGATVSLSGRPSSAPAGAASSAASSPSHP